MNEHGRHHVRPVEDVLNRLKIRRDGYVNVDIEKVSQLGIRWMEKDNDHRDSGWYAKIDGRDLKLSNQAVNSVSKMVKVTDMRYWNQFADKNAFPKTLSHILENTPSQSSVDRAEPKRLMIRHDGIQVRAILPYEYKVKDAYDLLSDFLTMVSESMGKINGVSSLETGDSGDINSYRVVVGTNIVPALKADMGQYMMFMLACSETGANVYGGSSAATALGLFRTSCTNSAIRETQVVKWNHRSNGLDRFITETGEKLRHTGYYQDQYASIFGELLKEKLGEANPRDLLHAMRSMSLISTAHSEACERYVDAPTEDGRPVETQYDMFNVMTRGAQDLSSLAQRQQAESRALNMFTSPGGIYKMLRSGSRALDN